jgi:HAMP domain-containing protein
MSQDSITLESSKFAKPLALAGRKSSLKRKIGASFSGLIFGLGVMVIGIVYFMMDRALQRQVDLRSAAIATNLSDAAAGFASRKSTLELDALIAKYGRLDGVAYAYIQDPRGEILVSSLQPFPPELRESASVENPRISGSRIVAVRGRSVYETHVPLLDGQLGAVHVGLWADNVEHDVRAALLPIVGLISLCLVIGMGLSTMLASKIVRPILELKTLADDISRGHLDTPVSIQSNDEVGDLARSLERMRASLKAAMIRLNKD